MVPLVSVVIPTYNRAALLVEAIDSVLAQTWKKLEIIVVDDGSTDNTRSVLDRYRAHIRYIFQANSGGCARPKNVGIGLASGKYIAFFDDDDIMWPGKIETQVSFLRRNPHVGMVFTDFSMFTDSGMVCNSFIHRRDRRFFGLPKISVGPNECILSEGVCDCLALETFIGSPSSVVAKKEVFEEVGLFDEDIGICDDIDMWFRIAQKFPIGYIDLPAFSRRVHKNNLFSLSNEKAVRSCIRARRGFLESKLITPQTRHQLSQHLGKMYSTLADLQLNEGRGSEARLSLFASVRRRPFQLVAYKLFCASLFSAGARQLLRRACRVAVRSSRTSTDRF